MRYIRLISVFTGSSETVPVFVNPAFVTTVRQTGADTLIDFTSGYGVRVRESAEDVVGMIEYASTIGIEGYSRLKEHIVKEFEKEQHR